MHNFTIYADADALPRYVKSQDYYGIVLAAVLDRTNSHGADWQPTPAALKTAVDAVMRPWQWVSNVEFVAIALKQDAGQPITHVGTYDTNPVDADDQTNVTLTAARKYLNGRFDDYLEAIPADDRLEAAVFRPDRDANANEDDPTPTSLLAFQTNLTALLAPIPQLGRLSHVCWVHESTLPQTSIVAFAPTFELEWQGTRVRCRKEEIEAAVSDWLASADAQTQFDGRTIDLVVTPVDANGTPLAISVALRCGAWERDLGSGGAPNSIHSALWPNGDIELTQGASHRKLTERISEGFDLAEPAMRALERFAAIPEPQSAFRWMAALVRGQTIPSERIVRRIVRETHVDDAEDLAVVNAWKAFLVSIASPAAWDGEVREISRDVADAFFYWENKDQTLERRHALAIRVEKDVVEIEGELVFSRANTSTAWSIASARLVAHWKYAVGILPLGYALQYWDTGLRGWKDYAGKTVWEKQDDGTLLVDVSEVARAGLRSGRHRIVADFEGTLSEIGRFEIGTDEKALAPLRALRAATQGEAAQTAFALALFREAMTRYGQSAWLARTEATLRDTLLPSLASRAAIRGDRLYEEIRSAAATNAFEAKLLAYWAAVKTGFGAMPTEIAAVLDSEIERHAKAWMKTGEYANLNDRTSASALPFEIRLAAPVPDNAQFDDPSQPNEIDPLARLAGAGILFRRGTDPWKCLNAAIMSEVEGYSPIGAVPLPIGYTDGVAVVSASYSGTPVAIAPPSTDGADYYALAEPEARERATSLATYEIVPETELKDRPWAVCPLLAFGKTYDASVFFVHRCGALPAGLANPDAPWLMKKEPDDPPKFSQALYRRTVPVGAPRLSIAANLAKSREIAAPEFGGYIPEGVFPLARDLPRIGVTLGGPARRFFRDGLRGTLGLDEGSWSLRLDGIEPRGFAGVATLEATVSGQRVDTGGAIYAKFRISSKIDGGATKLEIVVSDGTTEAAVRFEALPEGVPFGILIEAKQRLGISPPELRASAWATDDASIVAFGSFAPADRVPADIAKISDAWLEVGATGTAAAGKSASVSFGSPRAETPRGAFDAAEADKTPVVLLANDAGLDLERTKIGLQARPPAVDFECWDRRAARHQLDGTVNAAGHRVNVSIGWHIGLQLNEEAQLAGLPPAVDLGLYDPSVTQLLYEFVPLFARKNSGVARKPIPLDALLDPKPHEPGANEMATPANVQKFLEGAVAKSPKDIDSVGFGETLPVLSGEVWLLSVRALVPEAEAIHFGSAVRSLLVEYVDAGKKYYAGPAASVLVETATLELPNFPQLRSALDISTAGRSVSLRHSPGRTATVDADWNWRGHLVAYVREASLARQLWRWNGRPPADGYPYPFGKLVDGRIDDARNLPDFHLEFLHWEAASFGDRDPSDYLATSHILRPFVETSLRREDVSHDDRAQHWRFSLSARSRYAAIVEDRKLRAVPEPPKDAPLRDLWRRAFVPAVPPPELKPPSVRALLPLTQNGESGGTLGPPPILAVLDDPWYDIGGLAEKLEVSIETARGDIGHTVDGNGGPDWWYARKAALQEAGPDPRRTADYWPYRETQDDGGQSSTLSTVDKVRCRIEGPIGYTYDDGASAQRFAHSAFVLHLERDGGIPDWSMVKLSFARQLDKAGCGGQYASNPSSRFTKGMWCQLASDFSLYESDRGRFRARDLYIEGPLSFDVDGYRNPFRSRAAAQPVLLRPHSPSDSASMARVELWAVVNEALVDASRRSVERYVGIFRVTGDKLIQIHPAPDPGNPIVCDRPIVRILEVECRKTDAGNPEIELNDIWPATRGGEDWDINSAPDAKARIVKVGQPIVVGR